MPGKRKRIITVLMIEPEMPEGVSARKLIVETAKHNVITAYGGEEGLLLFERFPNVDVVFLHSQLRGEDCEQVAKNLRRLSPTVPIVVLSPTGHVRCNQDAISTLPSHEPQAILDYLKERLGAPVSN